MVTHSNPCSMGGGSFGTLSGSMILIGPSSTLPASSRSPLQHATSLGSHDRTDRISVPAAFARICTRPCLFDFWLPRSIFTSTSLCWSTSLLDKTEPRHDIPSPSANPRDPISSASPTRALCLSPQPRPSMRGSPRGSDPPFRL